MTILHPQEQFRKYRFVDTFLETLSSYTELCKSVSLDPNLRGLEAYKALKAKLQFDEAKKLWTLLEKKEALKEYYKVPGHHACKGKKVLIVGAGPCGLRMAIECALLGASVTVIDMRSYISRNNVLHLWPFVITDVKSIGGKIFNPKFCVGAIDHVSIKSLQLMLMKISLILGVKINTPVQFQKIIEPSQDHLGWRVAVTPEDHNVNNLDFDFIIGANGKNNSLPDFTRKTMRGKLAIAITANFLNKKSTADAKVVEIGGLSYIFDQEFFNGLKQKTGADLENFVYFKDDTHYFVMTPKKSCLLREGVIKQDFSDAKKLLARENIDYEKLTSFTRAVALASTNNQLPCKEFARNHHDIEDLAIFDFTSISMANHSCFVKELYGSELVQCIVGDSLLEPFWPTGTGCARGFLGVFDAAWFIREWCNDEYSKLQIIAQRETIFKTLSQTKPESKASVINKYTIDPTTRYGTKLKIKTMIPSNRVRHLYIQLSGPSQQIPSPVAGQTVRDGGNNDDAVMAEADNVVDNDTPAMMMMDDEEEERRMRSLSRKRTGTLNSRQLLAFYQEKLAPFSDIVTVNDLNQSWINGMALCAIVQCFRPNLLDVHDMDKEEVATNLQIAFMLIEQEFGVSPMFGAEELAQRAEVDKLAMLSYLAQIRQAIEDNEPSTKMPRLSEIVEEDAFLSMSAKPSQATEEYKEHGYVMEDDDVTSMNARGMLVKLSRSTALQELKQRVENAKVWMDDGKQSKDKEGTDNEQTKEAMRKAILMSTNQMPSKLRKSDDTKKKLTRKKVLFREQPPSVHKFRVRESQDVNIGGSAMPCLSTDEHGVLTSGSYDNVTEDIQHQDSDSGPDSASGHKSLEQCKVVPVSARIANFISITGQAPKRQKNVVKRQEEQSTANDIKPGRPSLMHCRGIAGARIRNMENSWKQPPKVIPEAPSSKVQTDNIKTSNKDFNKSAEKVEESHKTPIMEEEEKETSAQAMPRPEPKVKQKQPNIVNKLKGFMKKKEKKESKLDSPEQTPPPQSKRRGLGLVPEKMLQSLGYMACTDRAKKNIDLFEKRRDNPVSNKKQKDKKPKPVVDIAPVQEEEPVEMESEPMESEPQATSFEILEGTETVSVAERISSYVQDCEKKSGSNVCCICEKKLYLIERYSAHGKFFHKTCYRCSTCNTMLRLGNSLLKKLPNNKIQFFCFAHAYTAGVFDVEWEGRDPDAKPDINETSKNVNDNTQHRLELNPSEKMEHQRDVLDYQTSEDESSDGLDDDDDDEFEAAFATNLAYRSLKTTRQSMRSQKSIRLLVADEIQRGLDQVDEDEEKLEKEGHDVEDKLRNRPSAAADDDVMEEWLEVLRKKKELVDKESKLMLKKKLQELHDRQNRLQLLLTSLGVGADTDQGVQNEMKALEQDTEDLEMELECLVLQMKSLSHFLEGESLV